MEEPIASQQQALDTHTSPAPAQRAYVTAQPPAATSQAGSGLRLWLYGAGMLLPIGLFAWRYPLAPNSQSLTDIGKLSNYGRAEFIGFVAGMALLFGLYILALRESRRLTAAQAMPAVFGCGTLLAIGMDWMYPVNAIDVFLYAVRSRLLTTYGVNPSAVPFDRYPTDPWMAYISAEWAPHVSPYGPLWNLIAAPVTVLAGDRIAFALVGFKLLMVLCLLAGTWAIARANEAAGAADHATGALLYLWNPLVLWEGIGNGHNDVLLALLIVLALQAWVAHHDRWVVPLLVVAALVKYITLPLIPLAMVALWRRPENGATHARLLGWSVLLSGAAVMLALYPFYDLGAVAGSLGDQSAIFHTSPAAAAVALLNDRYPSGAIERWASWLGRALLLLAVLWQAARLWRRPADLPRACFEVLFVLLLVAMTNLRGWYLIWLIGLAALLPWGWPAWRAIAWSAGALASYGLLIWVEAWWQPGYDTIQIVVVPIMLGAALLATLAELASRGRRRPQHAATTP